MRSYLPSIIDVAGKINDEGILLNWYLFGSFLRDPNKARDIDILIIYKNESHPRIVREALSDIGLQFPLDLIFMTEEEESQFDFIRSQRAEIIYP